MLTDMRRVVTTLRPRRRIGANCVHSAETFELIIGMFLAVIALHYLARRLGLPPAVALIVGGGVIAFLPGIPEVRIDPELVLVLFLPPLLMDGAWYTAWAPFRRNMAGILSLSIGAVFFTAFVVAAVMKMLLPSLPFAACVALGAILSPPDAVSARAVLQRVKLPRRLQTLLEGESLLNDAAGLVLFRFAVAAVLTGSFSLADAGGSFLFLVAGGVVVGGAIGALWVTLLRRLGDEPLMIAATVLVGWAAYIAGELLHVSGVIATVAAGLTCGWYQHVVFTASVRIRAGAFWQVLVFLMEAAVFMLIGFSLRGVLDRVGGFDVVLQTMAEPALIIVLTVLVSRFVYVFGTDALLTVSARLGLRRASPLGARASLVLGWAGMRGVVTLAVALSLPETMPSRDLMIVTAFAVIVVTVLLQGTSLGLVIRAPASSCGRAAGAGSSCGRTCDVPRAIGCCRAGGVRQEWRADPPAIIAALHHARDRIGSVFRDARRADCSHRKPLRCHHRCGAGGAGRTCASSPYGQDRRRDASRSGARFGSGGTGRGRRQGLTARRPAPPIISPWPVSCPTRPGSWQDSRR
jgi:Na+/H+ antiporter